MNVAVVNYGVGNLTSILNMFKRVSVEAVSTDDPEVILSAERLLLPGVGHFDACMKNFNRSGLRQVVERRAQAGIPVLGICVGAQMMTRGSEEGEEKGLGWVAADTVRFKLGDQTRLKVPHMGWTDLQCQDQEVAPLWSALPAEPRFYFAHSFHFVFDSPDQVTGWAEYGYKFACAFRSGSIFGVQFHPEKSHRYGMALLKSFAELTLT